MIARMTCRAIVFALNVFALNTTAITTASTAAIATVIATALATPTMVYASDDGRELAKQCSVCHGRDGISKDPEAPNLAGQQAYYLEKSMKDYKNGARQDRRMSIIAQGLSDAQIKALAKWYASISITVELPE